MTPIHETQLDREALRAEWQTCEALLAESQKDNEEKHKTIERYKQYVKELEKLAETVAGPAWRASGSTDHGIPVFSTSAPLNTASTPLPKPSATSTLRYSTSLLSSKRSSRVQNRRMSQQLGSLQELAENAGDDTPTGALRRLQGGKTGLAELGRSLIKSDKENDDHKVDKAAAHKARSAEQEVVRLLLAEFERGLDRRERALADLLKEARGERFRFEQDATGHGC